MTNEKLDVLLVTVSEYYYIPKFLRPVCESDSFNVVGITTVPPSLGTEGTVRFAFRLLRTFGPRVFSQHASFYGKHLVLDLCNRYLNYGEPYSARSLARQRGIEHVHVTDVNDDSYLAYARDKGPDVIASVAATQKFDDELLGVPDRCAINIHSSLLPEYRGVSPSFWTLLNQEDKTGISVHYMDSGIDTGDLIVQEPLEIRTDDTLHSLNEQVAENGADVLLAALEDIRTDSVRPTPIDPDEGSYYSMPSREDVKSFLERGNSFY